MGSGQDAADRVGVTVPYGELRPCRFLRTLVVADGEGHQLIEAHRLGA
jgi:hypothetical protein